MRIVIDYDSTWRNSFLKDVKKKRVFKATSKSTEPEDIKDITDNTVLGVLSRLIGDQRKLCQAQNDKDFYFKNMKISFKKIKNNEVIWNETVTLINKNESRPNKNSFIGVLKDDEPLFSSTYAARLWSILDYDFNDLLDFIINPNVAYIQREVSLMGIFNRIEYEIKDMDNIEFIQNKINLATSKLTEEKNKAKQNGKRINTLTNNLNTLKSESTNPELIQFEAKINHCISLLQQKLENTQYLESNGSVKPLKIYVGALNLMLEEFKKYGIEIGCFLGERDGLKGFSKYSFNGLRDFVNSKMGGKTKTTRTPYNLTKADGRLEINLDIDLAKAKELKKMIECAGVSSFYLGKKGLAYVSEITLH